MNGNGVPGVSFVRMFFSWQKDAGVLRERSSRTLPFKCDGIESEDVPVSLPGILKYRRRLQPLYRVRYGGWATSGRSGCKVISKIDFTFKIVINRSKIDEKSSKWVSFDGILIYENFKL